MCNGNFLQLLRVIHIEYRRDNTAHSTQLHTRIHTATTVGPTYGM